MSNTYTLISDECTVTRSSFTTRGADPTVGVTYIFEWHDTNSVDRIFEIFGDWYDKDSNAPVSPESHARHFRFIDLVDNAYWNQDSSDELDAYHGGP